MKRIYKLTVLSAFWLSLTCDKRSKANWIKTTPSRGEARNTKRGMGYRGTVRSNRFRPKVAHEGSILANFSSVKYVRLCLPLNQIYDDVPTMSELYIVKNFRKCFPNIAEDVPTFLGNVAEVVERSPQKSQKIATIAIWLDTAWRTQIGRAESFGTIFCRNWTKFVCCLGKEWVRCEKLACMSEIHKRRLIMRERWRV